MESLTDKLQVDKATTTRAIRKLETEGYAARKIDESDHRIFHLHLTRQGKNIIPGVKIILREVTDNLMKGFDRKEFNDVLNYLKKISCNASEMLEQNSKKRG